MRGDAARDPRADPSMWAGPPAGTSLLDWVLLPWRKYLLLPIAVAVVAVALSFLIRDRYRAAAQFYPEQRTGSAAASLGAIAGLASQLGVGNAGGQSPQFYVQVLGSNRLLDQVLRGSVKPDGADSTSLLGYVLRDRGDAATGAARAMRALRSATQATVNPRTNIAEVAVVLEDPAVAVQTVGLYLRALDAFNRETRLTQAGQRRRFLEAQLGATQDSLLAAERRQRDFLAENRLYRDAPTLVFEYDRVQRRVNDFQALYATLRRDYDNARLDEVNDTPVITVIDPPRRPDRKDGPHRAIIGLGALVGGVMLSALWATLRAFLGRMKQERPGDFAALSARFRRGARRPVQA